jgi:type IV secretion system protein VirB6
MPATTTVFSAIGKTIDNATKTFVTDVATDAIAVIYPWALAGLTLYIVLYGYMMIFGKVQDPGSDGVLKAVKIMFIAVMALNADMYLNSVVPAIEGIQSGLTAAFSGAPNDESTTIYTSLDKSLSKGIDLVLQCKEKAQEAGWTEIGTSIGWWIIAAIIAIGFALVTVFGGIAIMVSTFYLKILFAIGPVFVMCLIFPVTARFFEQWFGYVLNHVLIVALTAVVLTLAITIYDRQIQKVVIDSDQNMLGVALELLIVSAILYAVVKGVMSMASALAGGLSMSMMGLGSMGRTASGAARGAAGAAGSAASGIASVGSGAIGAAKWAAQKLQRNNSVGNGGGSPGGWQPAYKQNVLENLNRKRLK